MALDHPRAFPLVAARRFLSPGAIAFVQKTVVANLAAGFPLREAVRLTRSIAGYVNGIILLELASPALEPAADGERPNERLETVQWKEVMACLRRPALDGAFDYGLVCLLDGALRQSPTHKGRLTNRRTR
jgi:hypothetical protein